jgi:hypothetical protein
VTSADVRVSLKGLDFSVSLAPFLISPLAEIESIHPNRGPLSGGTQVVVRGTNFTSIDFELGASLNGRNKVPHSELFFTYDPQSDFNRILPRGLD